MLIACKFCAISCDIFSDPLVWSYLLANSVQFHWHILIRSSCMIIACRFCAICQHLLRLLFATVQFYQHLLRLSCTFLQILCSSIVVISDHLASSLITNLFTSSQSILQHHCLNSLDIFSDQHAWSVAHKMLEHHLSHEWQARAVMTIALTSSAPNISSLKMQETVFFISH